MGDPEGLQNFDPEWVSRGGMVSERNDNVRKSNIEHIVSKVGHTPELVKQLTPQFPPFARRPVVDNGWFDSLNRDNVDLVAQGIQRITPTGIIAEDGVEREFDILLICTGFKAEEYLWPVEYRGEAGLTLEEAWERDGARAYLGITMAKFPNLFVIFGPNGQCRAGGLVKWLEVWTGYALKCVVKLIESGHRAMSVKQTVFEDYNQRLDKALETCIWDDAESYYVNKHGRQGVNMPWKPAQYFEMVSTANLDDYELR
jgi:4-hydroxyacetophenone monooxygenase